MKYLVSILSLIFCSCTVPNEFEEYIDSLDKIPLPESYGQETAQSVTVNYNTTLFNKFKHHKADCPSGAIILRNNFVCTVDLDTNNGVYHPYLMTYDLKGNKLDSLELLNGMGSGDFGKTDIYATIQENGVIILTDTTYNWKFSDTGTIDSTKIRLSTRNYEYHIQDGGEIRRIK